MRPTRRGGVAVGVVVAAVALATVSGGRALNAVAAPLVVALLVGAVQVARADPPTVTVDRPRPGAPGQRRRLALHVEGGGIATVSLPLPAGLAGDVTGTVDPPATIERSVTARERGVYHLGGVRVEQRDPLGLVARTVETEPAGTVVVYPPRRDLGGTLSALIADDPVPERQEFDRLREYVPGDPLRNVHWKSSAKHDDFLVMEFDTGSQDAALSVAASAEEGADDAMAEAAASVADLALRAGREVSLTLPGEAVPPGRGETHRGRVLRTLAGAGPGPVPRDARAEADVSIQATREGTTVTVGDRSYEFETLAAPAADGHRSDGAQPADAATAAGSGPDAAEGVRP